MKAMRSRGQLLLAGLILLLAGLFSHPASAITEPAMGEYTAYPIFQINAVEPNILIILDNSGSMNYAAYSGDYDHNTKYYGYFEPYKKYSYSSNVFWRDSSGEWDGNFLNWLCMRRIDVARKVLMGGLATSRQGSGNQQNIGEDPQTDRSFEKDYKDLDGVTPFNDSGISHRTYDVADGSFTVNGNSYTIVVDKDENAYPDEAGNFYKGNLAGVLQRIGSRARWANEFFNYGTGSGESGGYISQTMENGISSDLITDLQNTHCESWTPLAEAYYVAMQYFKQEDVQSGLNYPNKVVPNDNLGDDPYYNNEFVHCAKSFVLLLTDGASTKDLMIPDSLKGTDGDSDSPGTPDPDGVYSDAGSDYLDDVAYYARTNDLRTDLAGDQNLLLYGIYAFGDDSAARNLLQNATKNGGFEDKNGNLEPDLQSEWDEDGDGSPDTYYEASSGYQLETQLIQAINDILERAASGTAVSVLATSNEGEGTLVQAYFRPSLTSGTNELKWLGYLHSLWVDSYGHLREDSNDNLALDLSTDKIVQTFLDNSTGETKAKIYDLNSTNPAFPDPSSYSIEDLEEVEAVWEAGELLADRDPDTRDIFTYVDTDADETVDEGGSADPLDDSGEILRFHTANADVISPYLGVKDDATWGELGASQSDRVDNIIEFVRGQEIAGLRSRSLNGTTWKLGDIVHSTPVTVSRPFENFHTIYQDETYHDFYNAYKDRETVVYVGANDGLLHAFTSWQYNATTKAFDKPPSAGSSEDIGHELWAYAPQNLLPHLKWLPSEDYTHVYYMDQKPKLFEAKILPDNTHYTDSDAQANWGTFLLAGMRLGGGPIQSEDDFDSNTSTADTVRDFASSYVCLDVTEPRDPRVMWERTYDDLGFTTSRPAVVKVKDKWFAVFGSGPQDYNGTSSKNGHVFVVDLATGDPYNSTSADWLFETGEKNAFINSPVSLDKNLNYNVDAIYFGETYLSGSWKGKVYKLSVPWVDGGGDYDGVNTANYVENPKDTFNPWHIDVLFDVDRPVTAPLSLSVDSLDNTWVFGGTGRYLSNDDKTNTDTQYLFGVKDPFYNHEHTASGSFGDTYYHDVDNALELDTGDLFPAGSYKVTAGDALAQPGQVYKNGSYFGDFEDLLAEARKYDGWLKPLTNSGERVLDKPAIFGGILFAPSFTPNDDVCGFGGQSTFYGLYYETGTAYKRSVFGQTSLAFLDADGDGSNEVVDVISEKLSIGSGKGSSLGVHVGRGSTAKAFIQLSTGNIQEINVSPAFDLKSGLQYWKEK